MFAQKLAALGATPIVFPAIVILPPSDRAALDAAHASLHDYDFAIFVSANAVEYGLPSAEAWPARLVAFAPGPGTAEALAAAGIRDVRMPETTFDSEGTARAGGACATCKASESSCSAAKVAAMLLVDALRARGANVKVVGCYRRAAPSSGSEGLVEALRGRRVHAITVTSSEGVDNLWSLLDDEGRRLIEPLPVFAPHARIASRVRALGMRAIETGGGDAGLIAGLLQWAAQPASGHGADRSTPRRPGSV